MLPIMRPLLPKTDKLLPYLQRIDSNRWYSNNGPLNREYENRLSERYGAYVCTVSSATSGLTAALMVSLPFEYHTRAMVGMPSWTFCATANAIFAAGFRPLIMDVDSDDILNPDGGGGCQAFVVVSPFGKPLDLPRWDKRFEYQGRYWPVVVDAAAGYDSLYTRRIGNSPVVVSTHCTKVFGTGEGGFVLSKDSALIEEIRKVTNQGMEPDKSVSRLGINAKLSEYHAAVGLAEMDGWEEKRERWLEIQDWYGDQVGYATSTYSTLLTKPAVLVADRLKEKDIESRVSWYGTCHKQDVFTKVWGGQQMGGNGKINIPMAHTELLAEHTLFLPKFISMTEDDVHYIQDSLQECL